MSEIDPILEAWHDVRIAHEATCPVPADVALAAMAGPWALDELAQRHLLHRRCAACEAALAATWQVHEPPSDVLDALEQLGADGAYGHALRAHLGVAAMPTATRPAGVPELRWVALARRIGERMLAAFELHWPEPVTLRAGADTTARYRLFCDRAVALVPDDANPEITRLLVNAARLGDRAQRPFTIIVQTGDNEIVAVERFEPFEGSREVVLSVRAADLTTDDVLVLVGPAVEDEGRAP